MADKPTKIEKTKQKRKSKSERKHIRRMKQEARQTATAQNWQPTRLPTGAG
jgi:hypothetical protein